MVSPSTKSMTMYVVPSAPAGSPVATTPGTGTSACAAARSSAASSRSPDTGAPGGSRRSTSRDPTPSGSRAVKLHVSRDAPPGIRVSASIVTGVPRAPLSAVASCSARRATSTRGH